MTGIEFTKQAIKGLSKVPQLHAKAIVEKLKRIVRNDLQGLNIKYFPNLNAWRLRHGNYRVVYERKGAEMNILVLRVGPRGGVYK